MALPTSISTPAPEGTLNATASALSGAERSLHGAVRLLEVAAVVQEHALDGGGRATRVLLERAEGLREAEIDMPERRDAAQALARANEVLRQHAAHLERLAALKQELALTTEALQQQVRVCSESTQALFSHLGDTP
jgi:hypothetical protein